jgi:hypothetical protein
MWRNGEPLPGKGWKGWRAGNTLFFFGRFRFGLYPFQVFYGKYCDIPNVKDPSSMIFPDMLYSAHGGIEGGMVIMNTVEISLGVQFMDYSISIDNREQYLDERYLHPYGYYYTYLNYNAKYLQLPVVVSWVQNFPLNFPGVKNMKMTTRLGLGIAENFFLMGAGFTEYHPLHYSSSRIDLPADFFSELTQYYPSLLVRTGISFGGTMRFGVEFSLYIAMANLWKSGFFATHGNFSGTTGTMCVICELY